MLSIRNATVSDISLIRELTFKIWPETYAPILSTEQITYMLDMMYSAEVLKKQIEGAYSYIICYDNDEAVGFASWSEIEDAVYKLHKIYVLPNRQGKGIGRFMINYVLAEIKKKEATSLELNVNRYNPAKLFYERLGFVIFREEDIDIGQGYFMNDYVLRYNL